jgi:hypothetical protein
MKGSKIKNEWLKYFKVTVRTARNYSQIVERYYEDNKKENYFNEDGLFEIETTIRNEPHSAIKG